METPYKNFIAEKNTQIAEKDKQITLYKKIIAEKDIQIAEKDKQITELSLRQWKTVCVAIVSAVGGILLWKRLEALANATKR